jgi:imidazole glycerol-phosphate synthase subunit HisH
VAIVILDYGVGNLHSLRKALSSVDCDVTIATDLQRALQASLLVLPGVGAFAGAAQRLRDGRVLLREALIGGLPCLAICLGMQLLFDGSDEGPGEGLGLISGRVTRLRAPVVPHMGWNTLEDIGDDLAMTSRLSAAYFAHSFVCRPIDLTTVTAWASVGEDRFPAIVRVGATIGVQFHPEKSSRAGLRFLGEMVANCQRHGVAS